MSPAPTVEALLLGSAQDGGLPQAGCACPRCAAARRDPALRRMVACLALVDHAAGASWLVDATPDFPRQLDMLAELAPAAPLAGVILTHAHIGHYTGLINLGREVMGTKEMPVYATARMQAFLKANGPWSQLVELGNIALRSLAPGAALQLTERLRITPLAVPHRAEYSDTLAILAAGPGRRLFYCPDIDRWEQWEHDLPAFLADIAVALLDGSFFGDGELPGRDMAEIPHPPVRHTVGLLEGSGRSVGFSHLNHSNPLLEDGPEREWLAGRGHWVAREGMRWEL